MNFQTSDFGWSEMAQASEDEGALSNTDRPSIPSFFPVPKLELAPPVAHEQEHGREINFRDYDGPVHPLRLFELDRWRTLEGGNATTHRGNLIVADDRPILVAFKVIRMDPDVDVSTHLVRSNREVQIWVKLKHRNILPFIGAYDVGHDFPVLISPFCNFGHIGRYLQSHPFADRHKLVRDSASGLQYLHNNGIVHGDVKPENILIDKDHVACICDFGISRILDVKGFTTANRAGTMVYMAPELFIMSGEQNTAQWSPPRTTFASDVWAFGLVAFGIFTAFPLKTAVRLAGQRFFVAPTRADLENLLRPTREQSDVSKVSPKMWMELEKCWNSYPRSRPTITAILQSCLVEKEKVEEEEEVLYPRQSGR
ncbi:kinase-like domain-containing protein [Mycena haematopus]|nr:kinase-like domain-containing protein [Mycena haematopus]